jgi:uncharacterized protein with HEPN domain
MLKADIIRLRHMVDATNQALTFVAEKSRSELELIHGYFDVNLDIICRTVNEEMPPIARQIENLLSSNDP